MQPVIEHDTGTALMLREAGELTLRRGGHRPSRAVRTDDAGTAVMTDLDEVPAVTVDAGTQIDAALATMKELGVRSAFVIDGDGRLAGMVTAYDILGDKPLRFLASLGCSLKTCSRADVRVADIMERVGDWMVIDMADLAAYSVGDVVETFRQSGRTHIPVVEHTATGVDRLRGVLSGAEVARLTGLPTAGVPRARTFAEIERVVHEGAAL